MDIDEKKAGIAAWVINEEMAHTDPIIMTDDYYVNQGKIIFDMAFLDEGDGVTIGRIMREYLTGVRKPAAGLAQAVPRPRQDILYDWFDRWLDDEPRR